MRLGNKKALSFKKSFPTSKLEKRERDLDRIVYAVKHIRPDWTDRLLNRQSFSLWSTNRVLWTQFAGRQFPVEAYGVVICLSHCSMEFFWVRNFAEVVLSKKQLESKDPKIAPTKLAATCLLQIRFQRVDLAKKVVCQKTFGFAVYKKSVQEKHTKERADCQSMISGMDKTKERPQIIENQASKTESRHCIRRSPLVWLEILIWSQVNSIDLMEFHWATAFRVPFWSNPLKAIDSWNPMNWGTSPDWSGQASRWAAWPSSHSDRPNERKP